MEVLAGARDDQRELDPRRLLLRFRLLRFDAASVPTRPRASIAAAAPLALRRAAWSTA